MTGGAARGEARVTRERRRREVPAPALHHVQLAMPAGLAYGPGTGRDLLQGREDWRTMRREAQRYSRTWQAPAPPGGADALAARVAAEAVEVETMGGEAVRFRYRRVVTLVGRDAAQTMPELRALANRVRKALGEPHVVVLACLPPRVDDEAERHSGPHFLAFVSPQLAAAGISADGLVKRIAEGVGGKGGGTAREAFGGGGDCARLEEALAALQAFRAT
jgi:alanyl-tRNA synthetase